MQEAISQIELSKIPSSELAGELTGPVATRTHRMSGSQLGPRLHPIKVLHRHDDGYIAFAMKEDDYGFRPSFAIKASALESVFPDFVDRLAKNSYVSINAAYALAYGNKKKVVGSPRHRNDTLMYLCACYADIDHYAVGLTFDQARQKVFDLMEAGVLPWASMIVDSGRGMWLLWLLHDHANPAMSHRGVWSGSQFDSLMVYSQVNKALVAKLQTLGADAQATDGARYIRMPGSFRTDTEKTVWWFIQGSGDAGFRYTLWELADRLGVKIRRMLSAEADATAPRKKVPGRKSGQIAANKNRLCVLRTLMALRGGGFRKGCRGKGAWCYATCLRYCGVPIDQALEAVRAFGRECQPPLSQGECDAQTRSGYKPQQLRWPYIKIARDLAITRDEAEIISQRIGKVFPCADGSLVEVVRRNGRPKRGEIVALRQLEIQRIVAEEGRVLPYRKMEAKLKARGHDVGSYISVRNDYKVLRLATDRATRLSLRAQLRGSQGSLPTHALTQGEAERDRGEAGQSTSPSY